jgi:putative membrane-bound dehydrogenase-like protein
LVFDPCFIRVDPWLFLAIYRKLHMTRQSLLAVALCLVCLTSAHAAEQLGFEVPDGFEVSLYADDTLATNIYSLTIDAHGRIVVSGRGYVKILHDTRGTGKADKATLFSDVPKNGTQGMYFDGNDLICTGDAGVLRISDTDGDGKADKITTLFPVRTGGEHCAHGIVRGPDGWYYLICGNTSDVTKAHAKGPQSLVKEPNSGTLLRFSPDGKTTEIVAHGFRNPYDIDFNHLGSIFTVDADGERIYRLPWYTPCRLYDIAPGMHHGWLMPGWGRSWARPAYFPDNVDRLVEIGRGSPTGVLCYRHHAFPERYRNGLFHLCWSFGNIYFSPLQRKGASYESKLEVFMKTKGDVGFAPTDLAVGPDGDLFVSIGGRGTRGGVFRIHYKGAKNATHEDDPLKTVLNAPQPLSSWSRAKWVPLARKLGEEAFINAVKNEKLSVVERMRAVEVLTELFKGVPVETAEDLCKGKTDPELVARAIWSLGRASELSTLRDACRVVERASGSADSRIARAAWEALAALSGNTNLVNAPSPGTSNWKKGFQHSERRIRQTALHVALGQRSFNDNLGSESTRLRLAPAWIRGEEARRKPHQVDNYFKVCLDAIERERDPTIALEAVRLLQLAVGDVLLKDKQEESIQVGYTAADLKRVPAEVRQDAADRLAEAFPRGDRPLDLEIARLLGMLEADNPRLLDKLADKWTANSAFADDIHYLIVFARLPGKRSPELTQKTARALSNTIVKLAAVDARPGDEMPALLESLCDHLLKRDPGLAAALVAEPSFGVPGHELFAARLPRSELPAAARKLLAAIGKLDEERAQVAWSPELVRLVARLPDAEALPVLRAQANDPRLADSITLILAAKRQPEDRGRLVEALGSSQAGVVATAANALAMLDGDKAKAADIAAAVRALRRFSTNDKEQAARQPLAKLLERWTGQKPATDAKTDAATAWTAWFTKAYPKESSTLMGMAGADAATWKKRLDRIDWQTGDTKRGQRVFEMKCYRCHGSTGGLGPDLTGIGQRFSRDDLFTAILDPSKDILPAFQPTRIVTKAGKTYNGLMVYYSAELTLLQITPDTTVRIPRADLLLSEPGKISFMPTGLLDDAKDGDLADLYAYLKSLRKGK